MGFPGGHLPANAGDTDLTLFLGLEEALGKKRAIHSSVLAWKIPWTQEPGRLQSLGHKDTI